MTIEDTPQADQDLDQHQKSVRLETLELDEFERGILAVARHFLTSFETSEFQFWARAYGAAAEYWGETVGLAVAHRLQKVIRAVLDARDGSVSFYDPLDPASHDNATQDEVTLLRMLRHMRRDEAVPARDAALALADGRMDPFVIRAGLSFADRFSCGASGRSRDGKPPTLRVVG